MTCDICGDKECASGANGKYGKHHPQCDKDGCDTYLDIEESLDCGICVFCRKEQRWRKELYIGFGEYDEDAWG